MADATQTTLYQTGFAPEIAPYAQEMLGSAASLADVAYNPYMQYQGERQAQFTPMMNQSYENAGMMAPQSQLGQATSMAGLAGLGALNTNYTSTGFSPGSFTDVGVAQKYMNPYQQGVTDIAQRKAREQAGIADAQRGAQATQGGAFGGSRQAIGNAAAASGLATQLGDIQSQGLNTAYGQGMQQFNQEQAQRQGAAQLGEQSRQFGAGLGLQGLQTAMTGANTLGALGQQQFGQEMDINKLQNTYGLQQQAQAQTDISNKYQDYLNAQNYPYKQLGFMSDMLRGLPLSQTGSQMYQAPPSTAQNIASLGLGVAGLSKMAGGGLVRESRGGGLGALALNNLV